MTRAAPSRRYASPLLGLVLAAVVSGQAVAQATITGKVTNEAGLALPGVNVFVQGLGVGTTTAQSGNYTIVIPAAQATGQQVTLVARFIGYAPLNKPVTLSGNPSVDFVLKSDPFRLEQVVVTGVADATSSKKLSFSVAQVTDDQLKDVPAPDPIAALAGKVSGAKIQLGTGNPGSTPAIRLRGSTNLSVGQSTPLIIVDGVITKNSIADIDAQNIESIEVLKGAAAASFYGSDAANGVINITTKRGRNLADNHLTVIGRSEYGQSGIPHWIDLNHSHDFVTNSDGTIQIGSNGSRVVDADQIADNPYPSSGPEAWRNQLKTWLGNNTYYNNDIQAGLRRGNTNFNSSFSSNHNGGILPFRAGQFKQNARLNVDQGLTEKADLSASITYGLQHNDYNPNSSSGWFELLQAPPDVDLAHPGGPNVSLYNPAIPAYASPNARANPLYQLANEQFRLRRERILGSASARYRPWEWLRLEGSYGTDRLNEQQSTYQFRGYLNEAGSPGTGSLTKAARSNVSWNSQLSATASKLVLNNILSTTRVAYQLENSHFDQFQAGGNKLNVSDVQDLAALDPTQLTLTSDIQDQRTTDYMASQSFDIKDRYIVDGLYRRDGSSLFGPNARWADFYRVSGAYRLSEDFHIPGVQELKLRAARGTAGLRPSYLNQYEVFNISAGSINPTQLGNKDLKPAILTENEFGINTTFLDRFDVELVYADRKTKGAFLSVPLSPAQYDGFTSQIQNAADIGSKTFELSWQARVINRPNLSYNLSIIGDHTTQKILSMNRAPFRVAADNAQGQNVFYYAAGQPLGIVYGGKFVHSFAQLKSMPQYANAVESDYVVNPLGFLVTKASRGKPNEMPIKFTDANGNSNFVIGDVNPDFNFGIANDVRWRRFAIHAVFDGQKGGDIYNFSKQWMFQDLRSGDMDMAGKKPEDKIAQPFFSTGLYNALAASEYFVEDGSYVKLRELSVAYDLAPSLVSKIGLGRATGARIAIIGRNLYTWTNYSGFDPDVTAGSDFNYRIDGFRYPNFRTISGQFEIQF